MATTYCYRLCESQFGPVGFRELVQLVREGTLGTDDLVKADWEPEWHPAAETIGLFHMAGRADVLEKWEAERKARATGVGDEIDLDELLARADADTDDEESPAWQVRWKKVQEQQALLDAAKDEQRRQELGEVRTQQQIEVAITAAGAEFDQRETRRRPGRLQRWKDALFSPSSIHRLFRYGMAFASANLVAFGIITWSEVEAQRFPQRGATTARHQNFPLWGKCSSTEYLFLLVDAMILSGVAGYGGARVLESMAED